LSSFLRLKRAALALCGAGLVASAVACGGGGGGQYGQQPAGLTSPTVTATPEPISAADAANVYAVVDALETKDVAKIRPHVGLRQIACTTAAGDVGLAARCESGERDGDMVQAFYYSSCEDGYFRASGVDRLLDVLAEMDVYGVYRTPRKGTAPYQYSIVLVDHASARDGYAWEAIIDSGELIGLLFSCSLSPEDLVKTRRYTDVVPTPAATALTPTP
jgi:hypothetical protein